MALQLQWLVKNEEDLSIHLQNILHFLSKNQCSNKFDKQFAQLSETKALAEILGNKFCFCSEKFAVMLNSFVIVSYIA